MSSDDLGDRMKHYESMECGREFLPMLPIYARIDGRCFSKFTKGMERPYDKMLSDTMVAVTKFLVEETHALIGYTQSDEISLAWSSETYTSEVFFNRRIFKMTSSLAALASAKFNQLGLHIAAWEARMKAIPTFDCRIYQVPNRDELANCFLWRELDATKNAISMAAQYYYSHKELHEKNGKEKQEMLFAKGVNFNDYPAFFKRGTYVRRVTTERPLTDEQRARIPADKRPPADQLFTRSAVETLDMPALPSIANRVAVICEAATPVIFAPKEVA